MLGELGRAGVETWAMSPMPTAESIWDVEVPDRLAVVLGAEGPGLDRRTIERADAHRAHPAARRRRLAQRRPRRGHHVRRDRPPALSLR